MSAKQRRRPVTKTIGGSLMEERIYEELTDRVKAVAENVEKVAVIREDVGKDQGRAGRNPRGQVGH